MRIVVRCEFGGMRRSTSFTMSAGIHGALIAWAAFAPVGAPPAPPRSMYDQEIRPREAHIIWYNLRDRVPEVAPSQTPRQPRPPRVRHPFDQNIVAGAGEDPRPPQMVRIPPPQMENLKPFALPNVVAVPRRLTRLFNPPPQSLAPTAAPGLPAAPQPQAGVTAPQLPVAAPVLRPQPRAFTPPPATTRSLAAVPLPEAPSVPTAMAEAHLPVAAPVSRPQPRGFTPPSAPGASPAAPALSEAPPAPRLDNGTQLPIGAPVSRPQPLAFQPPPSGAGPAAPAPILPAAPELATAPEAAPAEASLAIVGLRPSGPSDFPMPLASRASEFSAGPKLRLGAAEPSGSANAMIVVPGLLARSASEDKPTAVQPTLVAGLAPTAHDNLAAAMRAARPPEPAPIDATRVLSPPDPRLNGRIVYTMAVEMPNVSSYSGSWIVWFAEHEPLAGAPPVTMRAPQPLRKVDPKYIAAAAAERVEGKVRLWAVIRKDGRVESVGLVRHLDERLDRSAQEALGKWIFDPAMRNGIPVDVDAVFEIPFLLAPRSAK